MFYVYPLSSKFWEATRLASSYHSFSEPSALVVPSNPDSERPPYSSSFFIILYALAGDVLPSDPPPAEPTSISRYALIKCDSPALLGFSVICTMGIGHWC